MFAKIGGGICISVEYVVLSNRKNRLVYQLMNEMLNNRYDYDEYINDDIQYGIDNEMVALELYEEQQGISIHQVGAIISESSKIHIASPDALSDCCEIVQEVKCTMDGSIHIQRIFEGIDSKYLPQCINYFVVCPDVKRVDFISYCGFRPERPLHVIKLERSVFTKEIETGRRKLSEIEEEVFRKFDEYKF